MRGTKFLVGSLAYHTHMQQIALSLYEADALGAFYGGGVDHYRHPIARSCRGIISARMPSLDRQLQRRRITTVPEHFIHADWRWEGLRTLAYRMGADPRLEDWLWERSEYRLDQRCARLIQMSAFDVFLGTEYGTLRTLYAARRAGKKSVVAFVSPHHAFRERWVDAEYQRFPELLTPYTTRMLKLAPRRGARLDEEARTADLLHANSALTARSLIEAGFLPQKIVTVPLGSPPPIEPSQLPRALPEPVSITYVGVASVRKGAHYLIHAWRLLKPRRGVELRFVGDTTLPSRCLPTDDPTVIFHGSLPQRELSAAYRQAAVVVLPTLCDGFGMVILEAMAHGVPVIATTNAGAAEFIQDGYNGFRIPPRDVHALADRIDWCIQHPEALLDMRRAALETARSWTWESFRVEFRTRLGGALGIPLTPRCQT